MLKEASLLPATNYYLPHNYPTGEYKVTKDSSVFTLDDVKQAITSLESHQQDLINLCMEYDGSKRPDAASLLKLNVFHEVSRGTVPVAAGFQ